MRYVEIANFASRLEAETIGHALDQYDIPFLVQSSDIGIFGPGHVFGATPVGVSLQVPEDRLDEVRELLTCVVDSVSTEDLDQAALEATPEEAEPHAATTLPRRHDDR